MKIKELNASERPRERLASVGVGGLSDGELLAILLRSGTRDESAIDLSRRILRLCDGSLNNLFSLGFERLCSVRGVGAGKAASVVSALELGRRFMSEKFSLSKKPLLTARSVFELMLPDLKALEHEECWLLLLNTSNYLLKKQRLTSGGGTSTVMDLRQILKEAVSRDASGIILVHNHPSGNPRPSVADVRRTKDLKNGAETCGVRFLDHVIVCDDDFYSFAESSSEL